MWDDRTTTVIPWLANHTFIDNASSQPPVKLSADPWSPSASHIRGWPIPNSYKAPASLPTTYPHSSLCLSCSLVIQNRVRFSAHLINDLFNSVYSCPSHTTCHPWVSNITTYLIISYVAPFSKSGPIHASTYPKYAPTNFILAYDLDILPATTYYHALDFRPQQIESFTVWHCKSTSSHVLDSNIHANQMSSTELVVFRVPLYSVSTPMYILVRPPSWPPPLQILAR